MRTSGRKITLFYAGIHGLFWMTCGLMFNFASAYLLDRGFSNSQIGAILGAAYALSAVAQPLFAALFNRSGIRLSSGMACVYAIMAAMTVIVLALPLGRGALAGLIVCIFMLQSAMQPSVNSLHRGYALRGVEVNFGFARGVGSAAYSVMCALVGRLLYRMRPRMLPALYLGTMLLLIACLLAFRAPSFTAGSAQQGVAVAVAAMTELPAMVLYGRLSRRMGVGRMLCLTAWVWVAKDLLTALAATPAALYIIALLQFASYAFYVPATVEYVSTMLPPEDFLKGQALVGTAFTLGSLAATFLGGRMLDLLGVRGALDSIQLVSVAGAVLLTAAASRRHCAAKAS